MPWDHRDKSQSLLTLELNTNFAINFKGSFAIDFCKAGSGLLLMLSLPHFYFIMFSLSEAL